MIPLIGFAPDMDPTTPGVITSCNQIVPTIRGFAGAPTAVDAGYDALAASCHGAGTLTRLDSTRRLLAGTQTKLYELAGTVWADVSKATSYVGSSENIWRFAQFGNASLAVNQTERVQSSTSGAFADIAQAPIANFIETAGGFVVAFGITDATVGGSRPDAWWCSNIYDYVTWTPAITNQAAYGFLLDTPGDIRGAKRIGTEIAVYKERSIYLGRYVGPPVIWQWQLISSDVGATSQECIVDTGTAHLFISRDDFYIFDGSRPRSIGAPVREYYLKNSDPAYRYKTKGYYDKTRNRVWWFYANSGSSGVLTDALVYHVVTNHWGYAQVTVQTVLNAITPETTWDNWPPGVATDYENIADVAFDSPFFDSNSDQLAVFGADSKLKTITGACGASSITVGDFGNDTGYTTLSSVKPRYLARPSTASMTDYTKVFEGDAATTRGTSTINGNQFDVLSSGRYHSVTFNTTGDYEMIGFDPVLIPDGEN
jgi:hypothetical protein